MRNFEAVLTALVDRVSPGEVRLNVPKSAFMREHANYEVAVQTRSFDELYSGSTVGEAVRMALDAVERPCVDGDMDPIVPSWYRVSRMQREIVERTLEKYHAEHMAKAAAANIAGETATARAEYAIADAFKSAIDTLYHDENDERGGPLEKEPLAPRDSSSKIVAKNVDIEQNSIEGRKERQARLAATVAELRAKNRARARGVQDNQKAPPDPTRKGAKASTPSNHAD